MPQRKRKTTAPGAFGRKYSGPFEDIVYHRWQRLTVATSEHTQTFPIAPFTYKMIMGDDFYRFTDAYFARFPNVVMLKTRVEDIHTSADRATVVTPAGTFHASWCMNSIPPKIDKTGVNYLDQHFRGWFIETDKPYFDPDTAVLMDFRTPQHGEVRFLYVLPDSATTALVEVAIFSNHHLQPEAYDQIITDYLQAHYPQLPSYRIQRMEQGNIPMTDYRFPPRDGRIIYIGMAGGHTRASTGYTFLYIHRRLRQLVNSLERHGHPYDTGDTRLLRHRLYDSTLLHVLAQGRYPGDALFGRLFRRNPPARLLSFLNGTTSLWEELRVMQTAPIGIFARAFASEVVKRLVRKSVKQ
ncbi:MAG: lycopene cyclase family protein [Saprospiraceae bacterium]